MYKYVFLIEYYNDFISLSTTKLITIESKYYIDAWPKAFEKALAECGENLQGISFLKVERGKKHD